MRSAGIAALAQEVSEVRHSSPHPSLQLSNSKQRQVNPNGVAPALAHSHTTRTSTNKIVRPTQLAKAWVLVFLYPKTQVPKLQTGLQNHSQSGVSAQPMGLLGVGLHYWIISRPNTICLRPCGLKPKTVEHGVACCTPKPARPPTQGLRTYHTKHSLSSTPFLAVPTTPLTTPAHTKTHGALSATTPI